METVRKCFRHVFLMFTSVLTSPKHDLHISWTFREGVISETRPVHSKYFTGEVREMFLKHALHLSQEFWEQRVADTKRDVRQVFSKHVLHISSQFGMQRVVDTKRDVREMFLKHVLHLPSQFWMQRVADTKRDVRHVFLKHLLHLSS